MVARGERPKRVVHEMDGRHRRAVPCTTELSEGSVCLACEYRTPPEDAYGQLQKLRAPQRILALSHTRPTHVSGHDGAAVTRGVRERKPVCYNKRYYTRHLYYSRYTRGARTFV